MKSILKISTLVVGVAYSACTSVGNMGQANRLNFSHIKQKAYELKDKVVEHGPRYVKGAILPLGALAAPYAINYLLEQAMPLYRVEREKEYQFVGYTSQGAVTKAFYRDFSERGIAHNSHMLASLNFIEDLYFNHQTAISCIPVLAYMGLLGYQRYQHYQSLFLDAARRTIATNHPYVLQVCTASILACAPLLTLGLTGSYILGVSLLMGAGLSSELWQSAKEVVDERFQRYRIAFPTQWFSLANHGPFEEYWACLRSIKEGAAIKVFHLHNGIKHVICEDECDAWMRHYLWSSPDAVCPSCKRV